MFDGGDELGGELGEDGESFGFDLGADAEGLAEEDGDVRFALFAFGSDSVNIHAYCTIV